MIYRRKPWFNIVEPPPPLPHTIKCLVLSNLISHSFLCSGLSRRWFLSSPNTFSRSVICSWLICSYSWFVCPLTTQAVHTFPDPFLYFLLKVFSFQKLWKVLRLKCHHCLGLVSCVAWAPPTHQLYTLLLQS